MFVRTMLTIQCKNKLYIYLYIYIYIPYKYTWTYLNFVDTIVALFAI